VLLDHFAFSPFDYCYQVCQNHRDFDRNFVGFLPHPAVAGLVRNHGLLFCFQSPLTIVRGRSRDQKKLPSQGGLVLVLILPSGHHTDCPKKRRITADPRGSGGPNYGSRRRSHLTEGGLCAHSSLHPLSLYKTKCTLNPFWTPFKSVEHVRLTFGFS
jgi:hypothetical protein